MKTVALPAGIVYTALGLAAGALVASSAIPRAAAQPAVVAQTWEYQTANLIPGDLQRKLTEMGQQGWQVFSIVNSDFSVDQTAENSPRLVVQRLEVTARRPRRD